MQAIKSNVDIFILFQISEMYTDLQEDEVSASVENKAKAGDVTIDNVMISNMMISNITRQTRLKGILL